ncbi:MAG: GNAT family N-acetyltransferase [Candidatus Pacebacteria bacterium]|nr:GNAT family N-acetyltransferase [Candidatus Paceibacterota bacterium]
MKILVYGSTFLTARTCQLLLTEGYNLVGYIPNTRPPAVPGKMPLPEVSPDTKHDLKLSIQYNQKIIEIKNAFNVHTGLLPEWGGSDILYHTIKKKAKEQGLTFHKMGSDYDFGPIICRTSYPVFPDDKIEDLYERLALLCPLFTLGSLKILNKIGFKKADLCFKKKPTLYLRGKIDLNELELYRKTKDILLKKFKEKTKRGIRLADGSILIRPVNQDDLESLRQLRNHPETRRFLTYNKVISKKQQHAWFARLPQNTSCQYLTIEKEDQFAGVIRLDEQDQANRSIRIGADIALKHRRQGIATRAYQLMLDYLFIKKRINRVWLLVADFNQPAINLYKKLGFKREGIQYQSLWRDKKWHHYLMMSILRKDYAKE